jgi:hypothetical protein
MHSPVDYVLTPLMRTSQRCADIRFNMDLMARLLLNEFPITLKSIPHCSFNIV